MPWKLIHELKRKAVHILAVSFIVLFIVISENFGKELALLSLVFFLIIFLELDYFRVELKKRIPIISGLWRSKEKNRHGGQVFFLLGAIISLAVFDFRIALTAILMTVFGDSAAALIGKTLGRTWISKKRAVEGILAEFAVDLIIAYLVIGFFDWKFIIIIVMAITATFVESIVNKLDDNLLIPLFSGFNGQLALYVLKLQNSTRL